MEPTGVTVHLFSGDTLEFPTATSARIGASGRLLVLRAYRRGFPEAVAEIERDRWWTGLQERARAG
jgi:hypothetical protein